MTQTLVTSGSPTILPKNRASSPPCSAALFYFLFSLTPSSCGRTYFLSPPKTGTHPIAKGRYPVHYLYDHQASAKSRFPFIIYMSTRLQPKAGPHPIAKSRLKPVEPNPHAIPISASPGQNTQTPPRKIRDPLLMKNPQPNHAEFETQHSLKCMCRQTSPHAIARPDEAP